MATKVVKLENFGKELRKANKARLGDYRLAIGNAIIDSVIPLTKASPVDTGEYAASWDFEISEKEAILGNFAPHAPVIEKGARPFTPPLGPLLAWAKRVLKSPSQPPDYDSEVWGLAKGTQNKIARLGMMPKNVLEKELPNIVERARAELRKIG